MGLICFSKESGSDPRTPCERAPWQSFSLKSGVREDIATGVTESQQASEQALQQASLQAPLKQGTQSLGGPILTDRFDFEAKPTRSQIEVGLVWVWRAIQTNQGLARGPPGRGPPRNRTPWSQSSGRASQYASRKLRQQASQKVSE